MSGLRVKSQYTGATFDHIRILYVYTHTKVILWVIRCTGALLAETDVTDDDLISQVATSVCRIVKGINCGNISHNITLRKSPFSEETRMTVAVANTNVFYVLIIISKSSPELTAPLKTRCTRFSTLSHFHA